MIRDRHPPTLLDAEAYVFFGREKAAYRMEADAPTRTREGVCCTRLGDGRGPG